jgi:hypothetical protein
MCFGGLSVFCFLFGCWLIGLFYVLGGDGIGVTKL